MASIVSQALGRGVTRSKRRAMQWLRTAAENGLAMACLQLAARMYADQPYAREVGHLVEAAGVAAPAGVIEGHDVPPDVLTGVVRWVRKGGGKPVDAIVLFRREALEGAPFCHNDAVVHKASCGKAEMLSLRSPQDWAQQGVGRVDM